MARGGRGDKVHLVFTRQCDGACAKFNFPRTFRMVVLALGSFIGLFIYGGEMIGWDDPAGHVQLALFMAFLFGIVSGYRVRA